MNDTFAQVVVGLPVEGPFDYLIPESLRGAVKPGHRVAVSFGPRQTVGFVVGTTARCSFPRVKPLAAVLDPVPALDGRTLRLTRSFADYYGCSWGEAIHAAVPEVLRRKKPVDMTLPVAQTFPVPDPARTTLVLDQSPDKRWPALLEKIGRTLDKGMGVLVLVPEVSLIDGVCSRLKDKGWGEICILDKELSAGEEWEHWRAAKESRARIVVGTRSAVFAPVTPLGLIIVTDEENAAYKQEQSPFYHVRDVARMRSKIEGADVIYASSAPSAEAWHEAGKTPAGREILEQPCGNEIVIVDQTYDKFRGKAFLSYPLQDSIRKTLEAKGRTVLFFNRRGFSTMTRCGQCGFEVKCERCDAHLTYMYALKNLVCPRCEKAVEMPRICPGCRSQYLRYTGSGVEKIESEVARLYPQAKVARYDRETKALPESADIIVATQAVMKYLDKLSPSLVGVLAVDTELSRVDFRSAQRVFSLLVRLRQQARKQLLIQTYDAKNYCLTAVRKWDFAGFYRKELGFRKELGLPPYWHILAVSLRGGSEASVGGQAQAVYEKLFAEKPKGMEISEPQPDLTPKLRGKYRFTIMVKGKSVPGLWVHVKPLLRKFRKKSGVVLTLNVDP